MPKIGRNTNGGWEMTSNPLNVLVTRAGLTTSVGVSDEDDDGEADSLGDGEGDAVAA